MYISPRAGFVHILYIIIYEQAPGDTGDEKCPFLMPGIFLTLTPQITQHLRPQECDPLTQTL